MRLRWFIQAFLEASHQDFGVKRGAECAGLFLAQNEDEEDAAEQPTQPPAG
jgi:hypothetical protein